MENSLPLLHPGILLKQEYLGEMNITPYRLAKEIGLTPPHVDELTKGKRNAVAATSLRLGRFFNQSPRFWLNMQSQYDIFRAAEELSDKLTQITPYRDKHAA